MDSGIYYFYVHIQRNMFVFFLLYIIEAMSQWQSVNAPSSFQKKVQISTRCMRHVYPSLHGTGRLWTRNLSWLGFLTYFACTQICQSLRALIKMKKFGTLKIKQENSALITFFSEDINVYNFLGKKAEIQLLNGEGKTPCSNASHLRCLELKLKQAIKEPAHIPYI